MHGHLSNDPAKLDALSDLLSGWSRPSDPEADSEPMFVTPPSAVPEDSADNKRKREEPGEADRLGQAHSASPDLKKGKKSNMKRTPQPPLAQSRLTSAGGTLKIHQANGGGSQVAAVPHPNADSAVQSTLGDPSAMDTAPPAAAAAQPVRTAVLGPDQLNAEFFRNLIGENTKMVTEKIETLSEDLLTLSNKVGTNRDGISKTNEEITKQAETIASQREMLERLGERVSRLESGPDIVVGRECGRAPSAAFLKARRSIRIWPVNRTDTDSLWKGAGEFIHDALGITEDDMSQEDIESIVPLPDPRLPAGNLNSEALITFFCPRKRDLILSHAPNLATFVDIAGLPTAGIRLEIPPELDGTFRLLSRFGTRLRARHGVGTKRHIKFDDLEASLFINVKLPGDTAWSRVSPAMAKADQESSAREESARIMKRISSSQHAAHNGPRQRLAAPMAVAAANDVPNDSATPGPIIAASNHSTQSQLLGVRPRREWAPRRPAPPT